MSSQRYRPNQQLEIYNFIMVPGLQISKEVVVYFTIRNKIYMYMHVFQKIIKKSCIVL